FSALKQDKFERCIEGYLPEAHFAFIDEVWKSSSSILNTMLTIMNERLFRSNGQMRPVNLETCMSASNEIPHDRDELNALWDRFLLRYKVGYIQEDGNFIHMLVERIKLRQGGMQPSIKASLTLDEIHDAQKAVEKVVIPSSLVDMVLQIRKSLLHEGIIASDRRYDHLMKVVQAHAYLEGRTKAVEDDLEVMKYGLWDTPEQIPTVGKIIITAINPMQEKADEIYDAMIAGLKSVDDEKSEEKRRLLFSEVMGKCNKFIAELQNIQKAMKQDGKDTSRIDEYMRRTTVQLQTKTKELFKIDL
ncbi:MAG: AAA family ATPase, partial [Candidatus Aenigmarchaeota archaeon]|nr:AAA family ATPase [Candidatus Aenigmarchaeota archaeon]